jgi:8-oxo-dGTP pyrophosphatase MutT (NUDIX family)
MIDLDRVRAALEPEPLRIPGDAETRHAAVAAILRPVTDGARRDVECLFIRRAERPSDPWSGHMAFPGGRKDERDPDLVATAMRETREEVGLELEGAELVGRLDDVVPGNSRGLVTALVVTPFVWVLRGPGRPHLVPNGVEVDEIHWAPLGPMLRGEVDATYPYTWRGMPMQFPGFRIGEGESSRVVWGMTHRMLETFFARLRRAPGWPTL